MLDLQIKLDLHLNRARKEFRLWRNRPAFLPKEAPKDYCLRTDMRYNDLYEEQVDAQVVEDTIRSFWVNRFVHFTRQEKVSVLFLVMLATKKNDAAKERLQAREDLLTNHRPFWKSKYMNHDSHLLNEHLAFLARMTRKSYHQM